ncbi:Uncharacterized conserved protein, tellurite resistance protein B (TerB) family [Epibacterium ulvae]|uniref:Uncharacterized conserved protein, tellurite resistance protein B (TerB) family n=2 Tax=Epibacterium ulvae TaxID=1156985 RepID=A0A1G5PZN6_9RHOB|nr:Uncharacterized conserved protein, tellurite resistance protein B (TerB) family [Epibacterium ulvae]
MQSFTQVQRPSDMFKDILNLLLAPINEPLQDTDARLALSALLVRIARSDHDYAEIEKDRIDRIIGTRFDLELGEATLLREQAEEMEAEAPDTVRFTRAIKEAVVYEERIAIVEAMWQVVLADGDRDPEEDALLRLATNLLGVNDVDSARIRQKVETDRSHS